MSLKKLSGVADGASAVAHELDTVDTLVNAAAKLLQVKNDGTVMFEVDHEGSIFGPVDWFRFKSKVADGASAVAFEFDTVNALTDGSATLFHIENNGSARFTLNQSGSLSISSILTVNADDVGNNGGIVIGGGTNSAMSVAGKVAASGSMGMKLVEGASTIKNVFSMFTQGHSYLSPQFTAGTGIKLWTLYNNSGNIVVWQLDANGDVRVLSGVVDSQVADGASAVAHRLNSENAFTTVGSKLLSVTNNDVEKFSIEREGGINVRRTTTAVSVSSAGEVIIGVTDTSVARVVTIDDDDQVDGRIIVVKDESGAAGTNNITVKAESGTIDGIAGATGIVISANYGVARLYSNGTNLFTW